MRLALKIPSYILGIIVILILAAAYLYYFTTIPESELNGWIASMISSREDLDISVRRINRDIWNHLVFESIAIRPLAGSAAPAVDISKVELDYDISKVVKFKNSYRSLVIDSINVVFPPSKGPGGEIKPKRYGFEIPVQVSVDRVYVHAIDVTLADGENLKLKDLAFSAAASDHSLKIALNNLSGSWPARNTDLYSASGEVIYSKDGLIISRFQLVTNRSSISLTGSAGNVFLEDMDINFDCHPIDLADISNLSGVKVEGSLNARGFIDGSFDNFSGSSVVDGDFFGKQFEDMNIDYKFENKALEFKSIDGKVFKTKFTGKGRLDFSTRPESFAYSGKVEHLNLVNLGPDLKTDFTGHADMTGTGLAEDDFSMRINCDLQRVQIEDYYFDEVSGPFKLNLNEIEFLDGFNARYKNTTLSATGKMEYTGDIDISGNSNFMDLTDFEGQTFLKELGGKGTAEFHVTGPTVDFDVEAKFHSDSCWTYGLEPSEINIEADLKSFISHRVGPVNGEWTGGNLYSVATDSGFFKTIVSGDRVFIDEAKMHAPEAELSLKGIYDGTSLPPVFRVDTLQADIYGNRLVSAEPLQFILYDRETEFDQFKVNFGEGTIEVNGIVTNDLDMDLDLTLNGIQIQPLVSQVYTDREVEGLFSGTVGISGNFDSPRIEAQAKIDSIGIDGSLLGDLVSKADYFEGYLRLKEGTLETAESSYKFTGNLPMNLAFGEVEDRFPNQPIDLRLSAKGNRLVLGEAFIPTIERFVTDFDFDVYFTGSYASPRVTGSGELKSGVLKILELESPLTDVYAKLQMENETIRIVEASATVPVEQTGFEKALKDLAGKKSKGSKSKVTASGTMKLLALGDFLYDIKAEGKDFYFKSDQYDINGTADFNLKVSGPTPPTVSGKINLTGLEMREEFSSFYNPEYGPEEMAIEDSSSWNLNLDITAQKNLLIKNSEVDAEFKADLHVERNVGIYNVLGTMEAIRGNYTLVTQKFKFVSGTMTFQDVTGINPKIDFIVSTRVRGQVREASFTEVELQITGTLFEPTINATSGSGLSKEDVLRLLVESNLRSTGSTADVIGIGDAFIRSIRLDPRVAKGVLEDIEFSAGENQEEKARISIAKYISPDLYVGYSQRLSTDNPGRLYSVEYYWKKYIIFKASQGQQSSDYEGISFDINFNYEF